MGGFERLVHPQSTLALASPIPSALPQNTGWQQFQKKVNATVKMNYVPQADYAAKWGTVTAGGDLPDLLYISLVPVPPFGHDGGPGTALLGPGNFGWVTMKKSSPDRVRELLGIMNYLASPIGSEEFLVTKFGMEGIDWIYDERGAPKYTQAGLNNMPAGPNVGPWGYVSTPAPYLFSSEVPEFAKFASAEEKKVLAVGVTDPTLGYSSATDARTGAQRERLIFDAVSGIAAGRKPMSDLDQLIKDWKARAATGSGPNTKRRSRLSARRRLLTSRTTLVGRSGGDDDDGRG